jgi:hypothetical protein
MGRSAYAYYGASLKALSDRFGMEADLEENDNQLVCNIRAVDKQKIVVRDYSTQA